MRSYKEFVERKSREFGSNFDESDMNPNFIKYFENEERITVDFGYETKRGTIGVTTGWKPCFLLLLTKRSLGSSWTIGKNDKVI
jgi:hypothetical protein